MEKSIVRSLPPLVQGKLAGVFEFAVEKIKITEKIFENQNSNLLIKVLWWGETEPLFVRPKKFQFITKDDNEVTINEPAEQIKYEVHTDLKLFKSYLEKCEVVELVILNSLQNEVIGSTLIHDLINLIFYTHFFNSSVINHSGDSIGEISCQLSFKEVNTTKCVEGIETNTKASPVKKWSARNLKINLNTLNLHSSREKIDRGSELNKKNNSSSVLCEFSNINKNVLDDLYSQRSSNLHYNSPVTQYSELEVDSKFPKVSEYSGKKGELINDSLKNSSSICIDSKEALNLNPPMHLGKSQKSSVTDSSKSLCKANLSVEPPRSVQANVKNKKKIMNKSKNTYLVNKSQEENVNKNRVWNIAHSQKIINKKTITSKVKSYTENKAQKNKDICTERTFVGSKKNQQSILTCSNVNGNPRRGKISNGGAKPTGNIKSFMKVSKEISKLNKLYLNPSKDPDNDHSDLEKVPVKEVISGRDAQDHDSLEEKNKKGKGNEKYINMTESCGNCKSSTTNTEDYKSEKFYQSNEQSEYTSNLKKVNVDKKLRFDLNDPIEKIYYETFFLRSDNVCNNEFEIAELLNQPENKYILDVTQRRTLCDNGQLDKHLSPGKGDVNIRNTFPFSDKNDKKNDDRTSEEKLTDPPNLRKDKEDSCIKYELLEPVTDVPEDSNLKSKSQREYKVDCHRCKYYKKLNELDKIIESLRIFETRLKNEVVLSGQNLNADDSSKNFTYGRPLLPRSNPSVQTVKDNKCRRIEHSDEELALGLDIDGSDFSKEDSDFIEFTHYLSKR